MSKHYDQIKANERVRDAAERLRDARCPRVPSGHALPADEYFQRWGDLVKALDEAAAR